MAAHSIVTLLIAGVLAGNPLSLRAQTAAPIEQLRFFTSPAERQRLDALRQRANQPRTKQVAAEKKPPPLPPVKVQGIVLRSNGPNAVWVNDGNTLRDDRITGGMRVQAGEGGVARVEIPDRGSVALRPGQSYDPASGKTTGIRIHKNP